jgi:hypothetical protein
LVVKVMMLGNLANLLAGDGEEVFLSLEWE